MATGRKGKKGISLGKVAEFCGVTRKTILRWVQDGLLPSFKLPGGHHRVLPDDLAVFLREHDMPVPPHLLEEERKRVLVADDDPHILRLIKDLLQPYFVIQQANNGVEACIRLGAEKPDLLVLDILMPNMDGIEVLRQMRKDDHLAGTKVVVTSAHADDEMRKRLDGMVSAVLEKPFAPRELIEACLEAMQTSK